MYDKIGKGCVVTVLLPIGVVLSPILIVIFLTTLPDILFDDPETSEGMFAQVCIKFVWITFVLAGAMYLVYYLVGIYGVS